MSGGVLAGISIFCCVVSVANIAWFVFMQKRNDAVYEFRSRALNYFRAKRDFSGYDAMPSYDEMFWQLRKWDWSEYLK